MDEMPRKLILLLDETQLDDDDVAAGAGLCGGQWLSLMAEWSPRSVEVGSHPNFHYIPQGRYQEGRRFQQLGLTTAEMSNGGTCWIVHMQLGGGKGSLGLLDNLFSEVSRLVDVGGVLGDHLDLGVDIFMSVHLSHVLADRDAAVGKWHPHQSFMKTLELFGEHLRCVWLNACRSGEGHFMRTLSTQLKRSGMEKLIVIGHGRDVGAAEDFHLTAGLASRTLLRIVCNQEGLEPRQIWERAAASEDGKALKLRVAQPCLKGVTSKGTRKRKRGRR